ERVGRRLRRARLRGRVVKLKLRFPPFRTISRQISLDVASDDDLAIYRAVVGLFDAAHGGRPVRLLGVGVAGLTDEVEPAQGGLFEAPTESKSADVLRAMDAIRDRFGEDAIRHGK
ncbi:MAG: DNA polymerase IV, partial [Planctomycetes bacterium]|nr:DNA polymerase IV [Planctomycetota bacterium]